LTSHSVWYNNNVEKDNEINKKVVGKTFKCDREYVMKKEPKNKKPSKNKESKKCQ
jgi:hypothetical protein